MARRIDPVDSDAASYRGLPSVYEFVNADGEHRPFNCGQAAACSILSFRETIPCNPDPELAREIMLKVESEHPPDNLGGWLGTSRRRVERICRAHGHSIEVVEGEATLRERLCAGCPVIVMLQTDGKKVWRWRIPAGHWMMAYGYDDQQIYFTNNAGIGMPWDEFRWRWNAIVPRMIGMRNIGLAVV